MTYRDEDRGNRKGKKPLDEFSPIGGAERREVCNLCFAEHLKALRGKALDVSREYETGARHLGITDYTIETGSRLDLLELKCSPKPLEELTNRNLRTSHVESPGLGSRS